jgi:hypothetical protein
MDEWVGGLVDCEVGMLRSLRPIFIQSPSTTLCRHSATRPLAWE